MTIETTHADARVVRDLNQLYARLASRGLNVDIEARGAAERLVANLLARGEHLDGSGLCRVLRPLVAKSPQDAAIFDDIEERAPPVRERSRDIEAGVSQQTPLRQVMGFDWLRVPRRALLVGVAVVSALGAVLLAWLPTCWIGCPSVDIPEKGPGAQAAPAAVAQAGNGFMDPAWLLAITALLTAIVFLDVLVSASRLRREVLWQRPLNKRDAARRRELTRLAASAPAISRASALVRAATLMQAQSRSATSELDTTATVHATARAAGFYTPIVVGGQTTAEYVFIIERAGPFDLDAKRKAHLVERLCALDIIAETWFFEISPDSVFDAQSAGLTSFASFAARNADKAVVLMCDPSALIDPQTGDARQWTSQLSLFPRRAWLCNEPRALSGEVVIARQLQLPIGEASEEGLSTLPELLGLELPDDEPTHFSVIEGEGSLAPPLLLKSDARRWLLDTPPPDSEWSRMETALRFHLDASELLWLSAAAFYPTVEWSILLELGSKLKDRHGRPIYNERRLARLCALTWFREGRMPQWFRRSLIAGLSLDDRDRVRRILAEFVGRVGNAGRLELATGMARISTPHEPLATRPMGLSPELDPLFAREVLDSDRADVALAWQGAALRPMRARESTRPRQARLRTRNVFEWITQSLFFQFTIFFLIIANAAMLGYDAYLGFAGPLHDLIQTLTLIIRRMFGDEVLLELLVQGPRRFFSNGWNFFDLIVVGSAFLAVSPAISILRTLRVVRVLRLVSVVPQMRRVVEAMFLSFPGLMATIYIALIAHYAISVIAISLFPGTPGFRDLGEAALTVFSLTRFDGWGETLSRLSDLNPFGAAALALLIGLNSLLWFALPVAIVINAVQQTGTWSRVDYDEIEEEVELLSERVSGSAAQGVDWSEIATELARMRQEVAAISRSPRA